MALFSALFSVLSAVWSSRTLRSRSLRWLLVLHLCLTLPLALSLNLWIDEAYSLDTTQLGLWAAGRQAIAFENQPPLYFMLLSLWRSLGTAVGFPHAMAWARIFSVLCLAATVMAAFPLARRYCPGMPPGWVAAAIAFNPYCIWAATEIRTYGFALFLAAVLLLTFCEGYLQTDKLTASTDSLWNAQSRMLGWRGLHAGVALISLYTNYFLGSLLIAQGAVLLVTRRWRSLRTYTAWMLGVILLFLPMLLVLASHLAGQGSAMALQTDSTAQTLRTMLGRLLLYLWPSEFLSARLSGVAGLRYGGLLGVGAIALAYRKHRSEMQVVLVTLVVACFVSLTLVLDATENASLAARYSYPLFLPVLLLLFSCLSLLPKKGQRRSLGAWGAIALICYGGTLLHQYPGWAKDGDWSRVAHFIQAHETTGQPVVVFSAEGVLPLKYHYNGVNPLVALPEQMPGQPYSLRRFALRDSLEIQRILTAQARSAPRPLEALAVGDRQDRPTKRDPKRSTQREQRDPPETNPEPAALPAEFWLVQGPRYVLEGTGGEACEIWGIDLNCKALEVFVQTHYRVVQQQDFYGSQVQHLVLVTEAG